MTDLTKQIRDFSSESPELSHLLYTDSNEDVKAVASAMKVQSGDNVACVTGSSELVFRTLLDNPSKVVSYDMNPAQTAYGEMLKEARKQLDYDEFNSLMGYNGTEDERENLLSKVSAALPDDLRDFWRQSNLVDLVREGIWNKGGATARDYNNWKKAIGEIKDFLSPDEFDIALGFSGTKHERQAIFKKVKHNDNKYETPVIINNNHFKFNILRYKDGIINSEHMVKYTTGFIPSKLITPIETEEEYNTIKSKLDRVNFETKDLLSALEDSADNSINRLYMSNVVDYFKTSQEKRLVELMQNKTTVGGRSIYLYVALTPSQRKDVLDHTAYAEQGMLRLIETNDLKDNIVKKFKEMDGESVKKFYDSIDDLTELVKKEGVEGTLKRAGEKIKNFDYKGFGKRWADRFRKGKKKVEDKIAEGKQVLSDEYVLIENEDKTVALYSNHKANLKAGANDRSFYGFDYAILDKVEKDGATYVLPGN